MEIEFDPIKSALNEVRRGLPFAMVAEFDWATSLVVVDDRRVYAERRYAALGRIGGRVFSVVFCMTLGGVRVISFRKANDREARKYEQAS